MLETGLSPLLMKQEPLKKLNAQVRSGHFIPLAATAIAEERTYINSFIL